MPILGKVLLNSDKEPAKPTEQLEEGKKEQEMNEISHSEDGRSESHHEMLIHPNFDQADATILQQKKKQNS